MSPSSILVLGVSLQPLQWRGWCLMLGTTSKQGDTCGIFVLLPAYLRKRSRQSSSPHWGAYRPVRVILQDLYQGMLTYNSYGHPCRVETRLQGRSSHRPATVAGIAAAPKRKQFHTHVIQSGA